MIARSSHPVRALVALCASLLLAAAPIATWAADAPAPPSSSVIHPGDTLAINVYGDPPLTAVVQADGTIQHPIAGRVLVAGMSSAEARDSLVAALKKYVKHPVVALSVQQQGQISVTVLGNVKVSGKYPMRSGAHLSEAIAAAGGVGSMNGEYPQVRVAQSDGSFVTASLQKLLHDGDSAQNLALDDNATVYVLGGETIRVQVLGAVARPGNVEVLKGDRLSAALARAGVDASVHSDLTRVYLTRTDLVTGNTGPSYQVDVNKALQQGDQRFDPVLQR
ncbi:MAG TPA: polysaccharide biosynthesis/export family protein, partial [Polyangia bacterium]